MNELVEASDEKNLARTIARYGRVDLLMIDELGYMELDRRGAELLFQVLTEREKNNSIAIASNESFSGWTKTFTDPRLCAAIVDRLTFNGTILETGTNSYRLAHIQRTGRGRLQNRSDRAETIRDTRATNLSAQRLIRPGAVKTQNTVGAASTSTIPTTTPATF